MDKDLVDAVRIPVEASDAEVQDKLNELYNTDGTKDKKDQEFKQVLIEDSNSFNAILAVAESSIQLNDQLKQQLFNSLKEDDQHQELIQKLEDEDQPNEISVNDKVYRIKHGTLKIHEMNPSTTWNYWRMIVPNEINIIQTILHELHCVPYAGHLGFTRTLVTVKQFFYWTHMTSEVREFVLDCPVCQVEKGSHFKPGG